MGMYDSVMVPCPACGEKVEFQSKAWGCQMDKFTLEDAPLPVSMDIVEDRERCRCGVWLSCFLEQRPVVAVSLIAGPDAEQYQGGWWCADEAWQSRKPEKTRTVEEAAAKNTLPKYRKSWVGRLIRGSEDDPFPQTKGWPSDDGQSDL